MTGATIKEGTEVLVVTHASKTLPELGRSDVLFYPGAPKVEMLERVLDNILTCAKLGQGIIAMDYKVDCRVSWEYRENLAKMCLSRPEYRLFLSPSSLAIPSQLTATTNIWESLKCSSANYILLWEHDHLFTGQVDWDLVDLAFESGAQMLRFNRRTNLPCAGSIPEDISPVSFSADLCKTNYYCNGPFIASRRWLLRLLASSLGQVPFWNGPFGGFVEGPINQLMYREWLNLDSESFNKKYPILLYGGVGAHPIVSHFGDFPGRKAKLISWLKSAFMGQ
ncbi:hypothetical protein NZK27_09660 [Synechococcus sp. FGCU-3]|nr:hypothetical protein [Synechococcus sp. FGCU3]